MECRIYGFSDLSECFLVMQDGSLPDNIIDVLPRGLKDPYHINDMNIHEDSLIMGLTPVDVLQDIKTQGYHLKWPTQTLCHLLYMQCIYCREYLGVMEVPYEADEGDINVTHHTCDTCRNSDVYKEWAAAAGVQ